MTFPVLDWHINNEVPDAAAHLGRIPILLDPTSPDAAWLQLRDNYERGWNPEPPSVGWIFTRDQYLVYPGLPPCPPSAMAYLRDEQILVYAGGWLVIVQPNGEFSVGRVMP
jgi:hypothetical protein